MPFGIATAETQAALFLQSQRPAGGTDEVSAGLFRSIMKAVVFATIARRDSGFRLHTLNPRRTKGITPHHNEESDGVHTGLGPPNDNTDFPEPALMAFREKPADK
ncbi:MAG: hypothetical protein WCT04_07565 [Planctomycetota bacterium]